MTDPAGDHLPDDLHGVDSRLRANRAELDALQLDQIKQRAIARTHGPRRAGAMRSRLATVVTLAALTAFAGGALAIASGGSSDNGLGSAAKSQYRPGKGCGDKNHHHTGSQGNNKPCPKPPHHGGGSGTGSGTAAPTGAAPSSGTATGTTGLAPPVLNCTPPTQCVPINEKILNACTSKTVRFTGTAAITPRYTRTANGGYAGTALINFSFVHGIDPGGDAYSFLTPTTLAFDTHGASKLARVVHLELTSTGSPSALRYTTVLHETFSPPASPTASFDHTTVSCAP